MGLFDKLKNVFTEEVGEEPVKKEVRQVEIPGPVEIKKDDDMEKKDEKFVFPIYFDDKDFDELRPKEEKKELDKKEVYGIKTKEVKVEKKFKPSPIISPVYGILDKNYNKSDIVDKSMPKTNYKLNKNITLDDVRKKAFGSLEDELENSLFKDDPIYVEEEIYIETTSTQLIEDKIVDDYKETLVLKTDDVDNNMTLEELNKLADESLDKTDNLLDEDKLNMNESDLFNLIDSMYEKSDENDS